MLQCCLCKAFLAVAFHPITPTSKCLSFFSFFLPHKDVQDTRVQAFGTEDTLWECLFSPLPLAFSHFWPTEENLAPSFGEKKKMSGKLVENAPDPAKVSSLKVP